MSQNPLFSDAVREEFGWPLLRTNCTLRKPDTVEIYTDGSAAFTRLRKKSFAGWGFAVFDVGLPKSEETAACLAFGPVVVSQDHRMYLGAQRLTNNTGEMTAVLEALLWILGIAEATHLHTSSCSTLQQYSSLIAKPICLITDSRYVIGLCLGKTEPKENLMLAVLLKHIFDKASSIVDLSIDWVKGHSGCPGNELADSLATKGRLNQGSPWVRTGRILDWDEFGFRSKLRAYSAAFTHFPTLGGGAKRSNIHVGNTIVDRDDRDEVTLGTFTTKLATLASLHGRARRRISTSLESDDPLVTELAIIAARRHLSRDSLTRATLSLRIYKIRRAIRKKRLDLHVIQAAKFGRAPARSKPIPRVHALAHPDDCHVLYEGREDITEHVFDFYSKLFDGSSDVPLPDWIFQPGDLAHLDVLAPFDGNVLRVLVAEMPLGKTGARDLIVVEILRALDSDVLDHLASMFRHRILHPATSPNPWGECEANLIAKVPRPSNITQFRPIAIIPVLAKLYSKLLFWLAKPHLRELRAPQFAFRVGHQAHEVVFILRRLVEVSLEWALPIWIFDGDIKKAYDYTSHRVVLDSLLEANCPRVIAAAFVRELEGSGIKMRLGSITTDRITRTRALFQGDPSAPALFNLALDRILFKFEQAAQRHKWGLPIRRAGKTYYCAILAFADNYWILATSPKEGRVALSFWLECLESMGWHTPIEEICYCTTAQDDQFTAPILIHDKTVNRISRKVGYKVLGTFITFDNQFDVELRRRISAAWGAFFKFKPLLCCSLITLKTRLTILGRAVHPALLWCAGSWNLRKDQLATLRAVQYTMIRKMMGFSKGIEETMDEFMQRSNSSIKHIMAMHGVLGWDLLAHRSGFRWAGKLVQLQVQDPSRVSVAIFAHRDWKWIQEVAERNSGRQLHCRILKVWRWERPFYKFAGTDWKLAAVNSDYWRESEKDFITWRKFNR